jgi:hypothetical protein
MPSTETRPVESDTDTGEGDGYAHYADKTEITRAAIGGGTVIAVCGFGSLRFAIPNAFRSALDARS